MQKVIVRPSGPTTALMAYVGEAPGEDEVRLGEGFKGASGQQLDQRNASVGINRSDIYLTNVIKERPPENRISEFIVIDQGRVKSVTGRYTMYEQALYNEIAMLSANVIVAVGNIAMYALTRKIGIKKWRGSILEGVPEIGGRKVIPIVHPAALLHSAGQQEAGMPSYYKHLTSLDLLRAKQQSLFPEIRRPKRHIKIWPTYLEAKSYLEWILRERKIVSADIEVVREELSCMSFAPAPDECMVIPFHRAGRNYFDPEQEVYIMKLIAQLLESREIKKVGQYFMFDASFLYERYGIRTVNIDDVGVAMAVAYSDLPNGLAMITSMFTEEPYYKDDGKKYLKLSVGEDDFQIYCGKDSCVALEAFYKLYDELKALGNLHTYYRQVALIEPLLFLYAKGIKVDKAGMFGAASVQEQKIRILQEKLNFLAGRELNANSAAQIRDYFYVHKGLKPYTKKVKKDGQRIMRVTTDEKALIRIANKGFEEARIILDIRSAIKLRSTFLDTSKVDPDGRMRSLMNPAGTKNGRLSSKETIFERGVNFQNQPHEVRNFYVAD